MTATPKGTKAANRIFIAAVAIMALGVIATAAQPAVEHAPAGVQTWLEYAYTALMASAMATYALMALLLLLFIFTVAFHEDALTTKAPKD